MKILVWIVVFLWSVRCVSAESAKFFIKKGNQYRANLAYEEAIIYYEKALEIEPNNMTAHRRIAETFMRTAQYEKAKKHWEAITLLEPTDPDAFSSLGMCENVLGNFRAAQGYFEKALTINPENIMAHKGMGTIFIEEESYEEAEIWLRKSIQLSQKRLNEDREGELIVLLVCAYEELCFILESQERFDEALKEYEKGQRFLPVNPPQQWRNKMAKLLMLKGQYKEAIKHLERVTVKGYPHPLSEMLVEKDSVREAYYLLGYAYMIAEKKKEIASRKSYKAFQRFLEYLDLTKEEKQKSLEKFLKWAEEERNLRERLLDEEENWELHLKLSLLLASMQRWWEAKAEVNEVLLRCPDSAEAHMTLGRILMCLNDNAEAVQQLETAMVLFEKKGKPEESKAIEALLDDIRKAKK